MMKILATNVEIMEEHASLINCSVVSNNTSSVLSNVRKISQTVRVHSITSISRNFHKKVP